MAVLQINANPRAVTQLPEKNAVPTKYLEKTFQVNMFIDPDMPDDQRVVALNSSLSATIKIMGSNNRKQWKEVHAPVTVTKAQGDDTGFYFFPPETQEMWGFHTAVITSIDPGLIVEVWIATGS